MSECAGNADARPAAAEEPQAIPSVELCSGMCRMSGGAFFGRLLWLYGRWTVAVLTLLVAGFAVAALALSDVRFAVLALMAVCLVAPMVAAMLYIVYGLKPLCSMNAAHHTVALCSGGVAVTLYRRAEEQEEEVMRPLATRRIEAAQLRPYIIGGSDICVPLGARGRDGFLWLPASAFPSQQDFLQFTQSLSLLISR